MDGLKALLKQPRKKHTPLFGKSKFDADVSEKYTLLEGLGTGGFSEVRVGKEIATNRRYAVKCILKKNLERMKYGIQSVENEVEILGRVKHKNVIGLVDLVDNRKSLYIVMELVTGGELFTRIIARGAYTERDASEITKQVLAAMSYVHSIGIVHRDLKPENLLYDSHAEHANIIVTDFGLAKHVKDLEENVVVCGTPGYVAPEVLRLQPYGFAVDCWGIGVITYILLCGYPPFYDERRRNNVLAKQIIDGKYTFHTPYWNAVSHEAKDFVSSLMQIDPQKRLTCDQAMEHSWIKSENIKDIYLDVSEQMKKYRARLNWKKAFIATNFIERVQKLRVVTEKSEDK